MCFTYNFVLTIDICLWLFVVFVSCPLTPTVSKASAGVMEVVEVFGYSNLKDMIKVWKLIPPLHLIWNFNGIYMFRRRSDVQICIWFKASYGCEKSDLVQILMFTSDMRVKIDFFVQV